MTKIINGFSNYTISDEGVCRNIKSGKIVKVHIHKRSPEIQIRNDNGEYKHLIISKLVMMTFRPIAEMEKMQVHHLDKNKLNNNLKNLIWVTPEQHSYIHKLMRNSIQFQFNFGDF